ncbi:MAG: glycosyltransferase family 39 protein [Chloroflexi bacterium]|nr:glycosyltransferase family 39 protein [Chloroflexota bacterium]
MGIIAKVAPRNRAIGLPIVSASLVVICLAFSVRLLILAFRYQAYLDRLPDPLAVRVLGGSDVPGWLGAANHFVQSADLSYWLLGVRPPLFPLTLALVFSLGGSILAAVLLQVVFGTLSAWLGYLLVYRLFNQIDLPLDGSRLAFAAGIILALDPASASISATLLSEPLFNLMFVATVYFLLVYTQKETFGPLLAAALSLALAMLARPTAIYFWVVAPLIALPLIKRWWKPALALLIAGLITYLGWSYRTWTYHGVYTYSMQTNFTLLFLRALSAEGLATGQPADELYVEYVSEIYQALGDEAALTTVTPLSFWDFHVAPSPEAYALMREIAVGRLFDYWPYALAGTAIGVWRMYAITEFLPSWFIPIELVYHALLYGLALMGIAWAFARSEWSLLAVTGVPILYISGLTLASQVSAMDTRMRSPITTFIVILATYGLAQLWGWWAHHRATREPWRIKQPSTRPPVQGRYPEVD